MWSNMWSKYMWDPICGPHRAAFGNVDGFIRALFFSFLKVFRAAIALLSATAPEGMPASPAFRV